MIYLDNAAMSWPKPFAVIEAVNRSLSVYGANLVRGGYHCAALAHRFAGTTETGTVRVSPSFANSQADINKLLNLVEKIAFHKNL